MCIKSTNFNKNIKATTLFVVFLFVHSWEQRKFEEIAITRRGLTYSPENIVKDGVRVLRSSNIAEDTFVLSEDDVFVCRNAVNIEFVKENDILITSANGSTRLVGKHAVIVGIKENSTVHGGFMLVATAKKPFFVNASMSSKWYSKFIALFVSGGNGAIGNLSKSDLDEQKVFCPNDAEQDKIGYFYKKLDNLITLHQCKFFYKKVIFKNEIFNGFEFGNSITWEQRKFEEIAITRRGLTYSPENIVKDGVRVLRSSNIAEDTFVLSEDDVFVCRNAVNIEFVKENDILITSANGSTRLVGKHAVIVGIKENSTVHGGFMLVATAKKPFFVNASMSSKWYSKFIALFVSGGNGAIGNLSKSDLDEQKVFCPNDAEQDKIGYFYKKLDNLITLHQRIKIFFTGDYHDKKDK